MKEPSWVAVRGGLGHDPATEKDEGGSSTESFERERSPVRGRADRG